MRQIGHFSPPNSIFFVEDVGGGMAPDIDRIDRGIWATASCVIVGCLMSQDGETAVVLTDDPYDARNETPAFDGFIDSPGKIVEISTSEREILLRSPVQSYTTRLRIWTNRAQEPDHILIVVG